MFAGELNGTGAGDLSDSHWQRGDVSPDVLLSTAGWNDAWQLCWTEERRGPQRRIGPESSWRSVLSVLFFSRYRSEGWSHHGRTFSICLCLLSFWLTLPLGVLSTFLCCPSRPCVAFLACVPLALFLALSLSPGNSLVSSWCDHDRTFPRPWLSQDKIKGGK